MTAKELLEQAEELRRNNRFGEAINVFRAAAAAPDATDEIIRKALASVELMQEINGFVTYDRQVQKVPTAAMRAINDEITAAANEVN